MLNQFTAWNSQKALHYVSSYFDIPQTDLEKVLTGPRSLENFVYDLFGIGTNDNYSLITKIDAITKRRHLWT